MSARGASLTASIIVAAAAAVVGCLCGALATTAYDVGWPSGAMIGGVLGLATARGWIAWMERHGFERRGEGAVGSGLVGGVVAGIVAAVLLHVTLQVVSWQASELIGVAYVVGLVFGVVGGALAGAIGGIAWNGSLPREGSR